jgi:bacterioferritin-associated ferredoxin
MPETINMAGSVAPHDRPEGRLRQCVVTAGLLTFGMLNISPVIVCHCHGVSDRRIRREARRGATCPEELAQRCGAGSDCGGCRPLLEDLLLEVRVADGTPVQLAS